jgi:prepilin-type N-terminal cleavage/methylation domain-containing protein
VKRLFSEHGFTLIELMIGLGIASILMTGITQVVIAAGTSYQLQQNLGALQDNARFAIETIQREIHSAGYNNQPWVSPSQGAVVTANPRSSSSDMLVFSRKSDRNCFDNLNPAKTSDGAAEVYLRESSFFINSGKNLAHSCRYGPETGQMVTQINNLGLIEQAEALQALYAEDTDSDGNADRWVSAGEWVDEANILAVEIALLLSSPNPLGLESTANFNVLSKTVTAPNDGRLRRVFSVIASIKSRSG